LRGTSLKELEQGGMSNPIDRLSARADVHSNETTSRLVLLKVDQVIHVPDVAFQDACNLIDTVDRLVREHAEG
jgi:hypothetical protein